MFKKILIANRGEIALRIIRSLKEMGIKTVSLFSDVDKNSLHTYFADESYYIGQPEPTLSYLNIKKIIEVAKKSGSDAIHPGYGFLAENPSFAEACEKEGLIFIGPSSRAMRLLGDKLEARRIARENKIPVVEGSLKGFKEIKKAREYASKIGYPVLLKASAGGGGKGMRLVKDQSEMKILFNESKRESFSAFGDSTIYIEKYLKKPRHIEFQVLGDRYGKTIHLGERECSIQRRYQKVIEESPSIIIDSNLRERMGDAAIKLAKASEYTNAGTIEFMVDEERNFYFLEVNARLQVEHPVTELTRGVDLVREQILVSSGERIDKKLENAELRGWAIECRINAEDPENNFYPSFGKIEHLRIPQGPGVRVDCGITEGSEVSVYYDSLIANL